MKDFFFFSRLHQIPSGYLCCDQYHYLPTMSARLFLLAAVAVVASAGDPAKLYVSLYDTSTRGCGSEGALPADDAAGYSKKSLYIYDIGSDGKLTKLSEVAAGLNVSWVTKGQEDSIYAVSEVCLYNGSKTGTIGAFKIKKDGASFINRIPTGGQGPVFAERSPIEKNAKGSRNLLVANYAEGSVSILTAEANGAISPGGPSSSQGKPGKTATHEARLLPAATFVDGNSYLLVPALALDKVQEHTSCEYTSCEHTSCDILHVNILHVNILHVNTLHSPYQVDIHYSHYPLCTIQVDIYRYSGDGYIEPVSKQSQPYLQLPSGFGPRHIAYHPNLHTAFLANEGGAATPARLSVLEYTISKENGFFLATHGTVSTIPATMNSTNMYPAEVLVSPDGKFVYVSNRDSTDEHRDNIAVFSFDGTAAKLIGNTKCGHYPRSMTLSGGFLFVGAQKGKAVDTYSVSTTTGLLTRVGSPLMFPDSVAFVAAI
jgi:6-phosphogluconolactonase (cycloisomerase 2 family)